MSFSFTQIHCTLRQLEVGWGRSYCQLKKPNTQTPPLPLKQSKLWIPTPRSGQRVAKWLWSSSIPRYFFLESYLYALMGLGFTHMLSTLSQLEVGCKEKFLSNQETEHTLQHWAMKSIDSSCKVTFKFLNSKASLHRELRPLMGSGFYKHALPIEAIGGVGWGRIYFQVKNPNTQTHLSTLSYANL